MIRKNNSRYQLRDDIDLFITFIFITEYCYTAQLTMRIKRNKNKTKPKSREQLQSLALISTCTVREKLTANKYDEKSLRLSALLLLVLLVLSSTFTPCFPPASVSIYGFDSCTSSSRFAYANQCESMSGTSFKFLLDNRARTR